MQCWWKQFESGVHHDGNNSWRPDECFGQHAIELDVFMQSNAPPPHQIRERSIQITVHNAVLIEINMLP